MTGLPLTRVLVVDGARTSSALLVRGLAADPDVSVVGEAHEGARAIVMARRLQPDVILMDLHLPHNDAVETVRRIMAETPTPIVLVSKGADACAVELSMHALRVGAMTVLPLPTAAAELSSDSAWELFRRTLKTLAAVKVVRRREARVSSPPQKELAKRPRAQVVAIGGSTGGPVALRTILENLKQDFGAPIVVTQHLASGFVEGFAQWLSSNCKLHVKVAEASEPLYRGTVYVAPETSHLKVVDRKICFDGAGPTGGFRPAISTMFESIAACFGERAVAVLLTGMGRDGVDGLQAVRNRRGFVIAQDEASSVVFGMPRAAIDAGLVDEVMSLQGIVRRLEQLVADEGTR